jgi:hypothetical protein
LRECPLAKLDPAPFPALITRGHRLAVRYPTPKTSYGEGDAKEMAAINTILIIVNSTAS